MCMITRVLLKSRINYSPRLNYFTVIDSMSSISHLMYSSGHRATISPLRLLKTFTFSSNYSYIIFNRDTRFGWVSVDSTRPL